MRFGTRQETLYPLVCGFLMTSVLTTIPVLLVLFEMPTGHQSWNYLVPYLFVLANSAVLPIIIGAICVFLKQGWMALGAVAVYPSYLLLIIARAHWP